MGDNEDHGSDDEPARVAEADKTSHFIGINDVLTSDEKILLNLETQANGRYFLLKKDSALTDLSMNFLVELSSTGNCSGQMETLDRCLRNQKKPSDGEWKLFQVKLKHQINYFLKILKSGRIYDIFFVA